MKLQIQDKSYLVLQRIESGTDGIFQYICRLSDEVDGKEYRAVRIPAALITAELIQYLMEQVRNKNFHEFVDYTTDSDFITILMDCGRGISLDEKMKKESLSLRERLEIARGLLSHAILSDIPAYFLYSGMLTDRVKVTAAMDFSFSFDISDITEFYKTDISMVMLRIGRVFEELFSEELRQRAFPEMEGYIYRLKHGEIDKILNAFEELEEVCLSKRGSGIEPLENRSPSFRLWEFIKALFRKLKAALKLGIILLALFYLGLSIYQFVQPEPQYAVYDMIGDLKLK